MTKKSHVFNRYGKVWGYHLQLDICVVERIIIEEEPLVNDDDDFLVSFKNSVRCLLINIPNPVT
jgi:hypothetical protein